MISPHMFQSGFQKTHNLLRQERLWFLGCLINLNGFIQMKLYADYVTECKGVGVKSQYDTYNLYVDVIISTNSIYQRLNTSVFTWLSLYHLYKSHCS